MMVEDFMPGKTGTFFNYAKKDEAVQKEENAIREARDVLNMILKQMDERIALYKSIDAIDDTITADPILLAHTITANKLTATNLQQERDLIAGLIEQA